MFSRIISALKSFFGFNKSNSEPVSVRKWSDAWTKPLEALILERYDVFITATDLNRIRIGFHTLPKENQTIILREFIKAICYYESGYNPRLQNVDVGTKSDKNTWSIGLMQISQVDQKSFKLGLNYSFDQLLEPLPNLHLALEIMKRQILKTGKFILHKSDDFRYWAVILDEGRYSELPNILSYTRNYDLSVEITNEAPKNDEIPLWYQIATKELGVTEVRGGENKRIIEYHAATSLKAREDEVSWCASFVSWVLLQAGYKSLKTAWARNYLEYGDKLPAPKKYCIMVFERNESGGDSHVCFWTGEETATHYKVLGGNQSNMVCIKEYAKKDFLGARWPVK